MKFDYLLNIENEDGEVFSLDFHTTRSKIDKLFFDLAFCTACSNMVRVTLYARHVAPQGMSIHLPLELLNKAEKKPCV